MAETIKMEYAEMEDMERVFKAGVEQLNEVYRSMQKIANVMESGALVGMAGDAMCESIRTGLCPAVKRLSDKYVELSGDIRGAMSDIEIADDKSKLMF